MRAFNFTTARGATIPAERPIFSSTAFTNFPQSIPEFWLQGVRGRSLSERIGKLLLTRIRVMGTYINAMETLVEQEVEQQLKSLPPKAASYLNRLELVAFALNQLPSLYATSERGLEYQLQRGRMKYATPIRQAVHRAIMAIQRDPIRSVAPLQAKQSPMMQEVLNRMRLLLNNEKISWDTLPTAVERAIAATARPLREHPTASDPSNDTAGYRRVSPAVRRYSGMPNSSPFPTLDSTPTPVLGDPSASQTRSPNAPKQPTAIPSQRPPVYGGSGVNGAGVSRSAKNNSAQTISNQTVSNQTVSNQEVYGWDDPLYRD